MEEEPAKEPDDCRLNQKRARRMNEGKIAIRHLPERDAQAGIEGIAYVPEDSNVRVLPENDGGTGKEEQAGGDVVAQVPASAGNHGCIVLSGIIAPA